MRNGLGRVLGSAVVAAIAVACAAPEAAQSAPTTVSANPPSRSAALSSVPPPSATRPVTPRPSVPPAWRPTAAPPNGGVAGWEWIEIDAPEGHKLLAVVKRPSRQGPFPIVVSYHGGQGFDAGNFDNRVHASLVAAGYMVVYGCWFRGGNPRDTRVQPVDCANAPDFAQYEGATLDFYGGLLPYAEAIVRAAPLLPGADPRRVALWGGSRGGAMVTILASTGTKVRAVVSDAGDYGANPISRISQTTSIELAPSLDAPVLMQHGILDGTVSVQVARTFEAALRSAGKTYEAYYYEGVGHPVDAGATDAASRTQARERLLAFYKKWVG